MSNSNKRQDRVPDIVIADYGMLMIALKGVLDLVDAKKRRAAFKILDVALQLSSNEIVNYRGAKKHE